MGNELEPRKERPVKRVEGRNLPFDALAAVCNIDTRNRAQVGRLTKALKDIRSYFAEEVGATPDVTPEEWEGALARAIIARARAYRQRFPRAECTPTALAAWWHQLALKAFHDVEEAQQQIALINRMFGDRRGS